MNSASVLEPAMFGWKRHLYAIMPPASQMQSPSSRVLGHVAQSESAHAWMVKASNSGCPSRKMLCLLLLMVGGGPSGSSGGGAVCQK